MENRTTTVAFVKGALEQRGASLTGACGAFAITSRVAWALRDEGIGLIHCEGHQNGCNVGVERYRVDTLMWPDGEWVDLLINAETENRPAWQYHDGTEARYPRVDGSLWRPPFDPDPPAAPGAPPPTPRQALLSELADRFRQAGALLEEIGALLQGAAEAAE
jgi:hypothetical protein